MKSIFKLYATSMSVLLIAVAGCNDKLMEEPRAVLTPAYLKTGAGLTGGVTSAYASFRFYYGTEGGMNLTVYGTDEFTHGQQVTNPPLNVYTGLSADQGDLLTPWNRSYPAINTCNAILEFAPAATDLTEAQKTSLMAEAKFIRAQWYFILVQTFGGVTLDLGSGPLKFNDEITNVATRASVADVYAAIIKDLEEASVELPNRQSAQGRAWKASARHALAKAYLTRGWSEAAQPGDFQKAYDIAKNLIDNGGTYGVRLMEDYALVHKEGNEYNAETLWTVEWINNAQFNNVTANLAGDDGLRQNRSNYFFKMFYHDSGVIPEGGMVRDVTNGRPFVRYKPTDWLLNTAFADKTNDSRYDKSFQTVWYANEPDPTKYPKWKDADVTAGYTDASTVGQYKFVLGDTAIWLPPVELAALEQGKKGYYVYTPAEVRPQNKIFPSLKKYDATQARPNNDPNISSIRPFIVYRLAETYLIAAEAAFKLGLTDEAADLINVIRQRAAWPGKENDMVIDASDITLDFILTERSRELAGEQMRWFDLVRTGELVNRVDTYNLQAKGNVKDFHILRPIPQNQRDLSVDPNTADKKYPQNRGY